jgi:hypothetical protein
LEFETLGEPDIDEAVSDSKEQLLTVVSVVIMEDIGDVADELIAGLELNVVLLFPLEIVMLRFVIVVEFWVVAVVVDVNISLLLSGSKADWDERLKTDPQSILLVVLLSTSSTSPNAESVSFALFWEANEEITGDAGKGVARPLEGSFSGWCSLYGMGSLNEGIRLIMQLLVLL